MRARKTWKLAARFLSAQAAHAVVRDSDNSCSAELQFAIDVPCVPPRLPAEAGSSTLKRAPHGLRDW
jgi:hypothetical protein